MKPNDSDSVDCIVSDHVDISKSAFLKNVSDEKNEDEVIV
jgi:hypothetical protein